ncbi:MAG TPA: MaoC/PaaZ C-terminal domain-containing protein [Thermoleophilaceae bacterium]|jgi:acyl dehydratase
MEASTQEPMEIKVATREDEMRVPFHQLEVGGRFISRARTITETDVVNFAALTADWHPLHTNAEHAKESIFGQRVAHGMLLLSYSIGLVPNEYVVALRRLKNVTFKKPVFFGDTIRVEGTVVNLKPMPGDEVGMVTGRWRILNQHDQTVFKLEIEALWSNKEL